MEEGLERWDGYVDWKGKPALKGKHGGMVAASFVLVVEIMENLAFLANASNLVTYLSEFMHFSPAGSATAVTNFMGTAFLLALLGGFLSDAFLSTYHIYLISALIEFLGLIALTIQAKSPSLKPPTCSHPTPINPCQQVSGAKAAMLFAGLYVTALGIGGIKGSLPAHGAEQFDENTVQGRKLRSTFFNYFVFCLSCGGLIAVTLVVWVEDNKGWQWGFGISTLTILLSIPVFLSGSRTYRNKIPVGSPLTTIAKVLIAAIISPGAPQSPSNAVADITQTKPNRPNSVLHDDTKHYPSNELKFLNRALIQPTKRTQLQPPCTTQQVEDVKTVLKLLPIFLSTIMLTCCLAQLSTFSVQQATTMNTKLGSSSFKVPPASLPVFPVVFIIILAPLYDHLLIPFFRRLTKSELGITHLQRIGIGLLLSVLAMAVAALVEIKRKNVAINHPNEVPLPVSFFWIALQYLFLGSADLFTLAGLLEFFFAEAPKGMKSLATSLSWASLAMGYYLSSVLVSVVNGVTRGSSGDGGKRAWLEGGDLNHYHLERFYWLMCVMSVLNFGQYLFWASRYKYRSVN